MRQITIEHGGRQNGAGFPDIYRTGRTMGALMLTDRGAETQNMMREAIRNNGRASLEDVQATFRERITPVLGSLAGQAAELHVPVSDAEHAIIAAESDEVQASADAAQLAAAIERDATDEQLAQLVTAS